MGRHGTGRHSQAGVDGAINKLIAQTPQPRGLADEAQGFLVFPSILATGVVVGAEYGDDALRVGGQPVGYWHVRSLKERRIRRLPSSP